MNAALLVPATTAGTYSTYVYACSAKSTNNGCDYGDGGKLVIDRDFEVS
jgi:hypothetical protein